MNHIKKEEAIKLESEYGITFCPDCNDVLVAEYKSTFSHGALARYDGEWTVDCGSEETTTITKIYCPACDFEIRYENLGLVEVEEFND